MEEFVYYKQNINTDCGQACLRMMLKYYGRECNMVSLNKLHVDYPKAMSLFDVCKIAEKLNLKSVAVKLSLEQLISIELPCILHWRKTHYVILYKINNNTFFVADPAKSLTSYPENEFKRYWLRHTGVNAGIVVLINPGPGFYQDADLQPKVDF